MWCVFNTWNQRCFVLIRLFFHFTLIGREFKCVASGEFSAYAVLCICRAKCDNNVTAYLYTSIMCINILYGKLTIITGCIHAHRERLSGFIRDKLSPSWDFFQKKDSPLKIFCVRTHDWLRIILVFFFSLLYCSFLCSWHSHHLISATYLQCKNVRKFSDSVTDLSNRTRLHF